MVFKSKDDLKNQVEPETSTSNTKRTRSKSPGRRKGPGRPRSPARTKISARAKSPARDNPQPKKEASPASLRSSTPKVLKARSPIRRSPSRKSPTRTTVTKSSETYFNERVLRPRHIHAEVDSDSDTVDGLTPAEKPQAAIKGRARRLEVQVEKLKAAVSQPSVNIVKHITQNSETREVERVVHLKQFNTVVKKLGEFSDDDETFQVRKSASVERGTFQQVTDFGGPWGVFFLMVVAPIALVALWISCNAHQCSFVKIPDYKKYLLLSTYFDLFSILGFLGYAVFLALLSVIPFGGKQVSGMAMKQGKFTYTMNGFFSFCVLIAVAVGLEFRNVPITEFVVKHLFHLLIASFLFGFLLAVYAYLRSFYVPFSLLNAHVVGRGRIYGFFMGRELNPRIFGLLDLKMYVLRLALIGSLFLDFTFVYRSLESSNIFDLKFLTLATLVLIRSVYFLDGLVNEAVFVTSFEIQYEGFGYMSAVGYLIYPFMECPMTKYVADYDIQLPIWQLAIIALFFFSGYILYRGSNNQKDAFRRNPYDPALSHLETIPTTKGKKLLCSGFWGFVRHPNYLGDIIMNLSWVPFAYNAPPVIVSILIASLLIHRSVRDNVRCKQKYGSAWDRYCNKVKYVLFPKIY